MRPGRATSPAAPPSAGTVTDKVVAEPLMPQSRTSSCAARTRGRVAQERRATAGARRDRKESVQRLAVRSPPTQRAPSAPHFTLNRSAASPPHAHFSLSRLRAANARAPHAVSEMNSSSRHDGDDLDEVNGATPRGVTVCHIFVTVFSGCAQYSACSAIIEELFLQYLGHHFDHFAIRL